MTRCMLPFLLLVLSASVCPGLAQTDSTAATEDIKAAYEKGDYHETLRLLGRTLAIKGKAAEGFDRCELLMLRAESHLHLRATSAALAALREAAEVAKEKRDDKGAAEARALTLLVKRSKNLQYSPRVVAGEESPGPIDVTDAERRPDAFKALYAEEKAAVKPKVQAADKGKTLVPVAAALKAIAALKDLEIAATGAAPETAETMQDLVDRAHKLMAKALDDMTKRTGRIADRANELVQFTSTRPDGLSEQQTRRRGLEGGDVRELKETVKTCKLIIQSCKELTEGFTDDSEPFEDLEDLALETGDRASDVLTDNYSSVR